MVSVDIWFGMVSLIDKKILSYQSNWPYQLCSLLYLAWYRWSFIGEPSTSAKTWSFEFSLTRNTKWNNFVKELPYKEMCPFEKIIEIISYLQYFRNGTISFVDRIHTSQTLLITTSSHPWYMTWSWIPSYTHRDQSLQTLLHSLSICSFSYNHLENTERLNTHFFYNNREEK